MLSVLVVLFFHQGSLASDGPYYDTVELMKTLADTYDDGKTNHLSQMGLKSSSLVKSRSGAMIAEKYSNPSHTLSAVVNRNENTGDITSIEKTTVSRQGSIIDKWNLVTNNITHTVKHNGKIETVNVTTASCNLTTLDAAPKSLLIKDACHVLTQANASAVLAKPDASTVPAGAPAVSGGATLPAAPNR